MKFGLSAMRCRFGTGGKNFCEPSTVSQRPSSWVRRRAAKSAMELRCALRLPPVAGAIADKSDFDKECKGGECARLTGP